LRGMTGTLGPEELERYSRQIPVIGVEGQLRLKNSSILVAGAGGLGSIILYYLVAMGVGRIIVIDEGLVELSNLQRQILYTVDDIGKPKATVAYHKLKKLNPNVEITPVHARITEEIIDDYVKSVDVVVDAWTIGRPDLYWTRLAGGLENPWFTQGSANSTVR